MPDDVLRRTARLMDEYATYWNMELPLRIHTLEAADDGAPQWHSDFARWLTRTDGSDGQWRDNPEARVRTTRAFRKLRKHHVREFEVLYRVAILGHSVTEASQWLNDRAYRNAKPERYAREDVIWMLVVAVDKVSAWF